MAAPAGTRPEVQHFEGAPPEERDSLELVAAAVDSFENGIGRDLYERNSRFYNQYRGFRPWRDAWTQAGPNDKDGLLYDAKKHWGAHLHIPLSHRTIEHMVPAAIAHRPRLLYMPAKQRWEANTETVRYLIDRQQEQIDIDLPFQAVMRSGRIYGIGVGKSYWRKEYALRRRVKQRTFAGDLLPGVFRPKYELGRLEESCVFDDPMFEDVDIFDFMWDPFGSDLRLGSSSRCSYVVHRVWAGLEGCMERIKSGAWNTASAKLLTEEKVRGLGTSQKYDEVWTDRMAASGFSSFHLTTRGEHIHELWEYHDGQRVLTVLDRQVLVQDRENPCVGMIPFQVYRPTPIQKQMVGIGDLEPLEHLQRELDTLRSQRRDAATLALCAGYAYDSGMVDEEDLVFGPGVAIEVRNGRPSDAIMPLQYKEVPGSGYQEEQVIKSDWDAVSGVNDSLIPQGGGQMGTATEAQLVQASLSRRIQLGSRRFELEVVRQVARSFLYLDQRMILAERDPIRVPDDGLDMLEAMQEGRWRWVQVGPGGLRGEWEIVPEGGSMAARNVPQDRQDAMQLMTLFAQNPHIEPRRPLMRALQLFGEKDPEAWLRQSDPPVPPIVFKALQEMGVDPRVISFAIETAQRQDPQLGPEGETPADQAGQGPNVAQVDQMMGATA